MNNTHTIYVAILLHKTIILVYNGTINIEKQTNVIIQERFYQMNKLKNLFSVAAREPKAKGMRVIRNDKFPMKSNISLPGCMQQRSS